MALEEGTGTALLQTDLSRNLAAIEPMRLLEFEKIKSTAVWAPCKKNPGFGLAP
jgi:hypothetical protein